MIQNNIKRKVTLLVFFFISLIAFKSFGAEKNYIMVFAPASLKDSLTEVLVLFQKETNIKTKEVYLGTAQLAQQIKNGASPDFFISANIEWMDHLEQRELILKDYTFILLSNSLVAITNNENYKKKGSQFFKSVKNTFLNTKTRISLAMVDAVPAGIYAKEFFRNIGIWNMIKFNVANSPNVRAALSFVSRGDLEYGVVYKSDAIVDKKVKIIYELDSSLHTKVQYPLTILNKKKNTLLLYNFLKEKKAMEIFKKWGFVITHD